MFVISNQIPPITLKRIAIALLEQQVMKEIKYHLILIDKDFKSDNALKGYINHKKLERCL